MARKASSKLTASCAQEIVWSMDDSGNPQADVWEYIADYCACGPISEDGHDFDLDGDELYDAVMSIRKESK